MPGGIRWQYDFTPGQFLYREYARDIDEWWFTPPNITNFPGDHICYQYDFNLPTPFFQEGDPTNPKVYWLDVQVLRTFLTSYFWPNWHRRDFEGLAGLAS
jgi:hypothetical protein